MTDEDRTLSRMDQAIAMTAPGTPLRAGLDMALAAGLGALICVGDVDAVLERGDDGFPLDVPFTPNRLFELCKMDGAVVVDQDLTTILRANFHLVPESHLQTSETGVRHRTAARMSMATNAFIVAVSERRKVVALYVDGHRVQLKPQAELSAQSSQLQGALRGSRDSLDTLLRSLSGMEFDNSVALADVVRVLGAFHLLTLTASQLRDLLPQLGSLGLLARAQLDQLTNGVDLEYQLTIRDYATDPSPQRAAEIRAQFDALTSHDMTSASLIARILGYSDLQRDSVMTPRGLRTLSDATTVSRDVVEHIAAEYGSLPAFMESVKGDTGRLGEFGVKNPPLLLQSLYRLWGRKG